MTQSEISVMEHYEWTNTAFHRLIITEIAYLLWNIPRLQFGRHYSPKITKRLADLNTCWDDKKLFQEARRINIAIYNLITSDAVENVIRSIKETYDKNLRSGTIVETELMKEKFQDVIRGFKQSYVNDEVTTPN